MSMLIFGLVWTAFIGFFAFGFFVPGGIVEVNGAIMTTEEAVKEPMVIIIFGIFFAVGLLIMFKGAKDVIKNIITKSKGVETFGMIVDIRGTGTRVNGRAELAADILTVVDGSSTDVFTETIGFKRYKYRLGDFLKLKHYNKDVNVVAKVQPAEIPAHILEVIQRDSAGIIGLANRINMEGYPYMPSMHHAGQPSTNYQNTQFNNGQNINNTAVSFNNQNISGNNSDEIIVNGKVYKRQ